MKYRSNLFELGSVVFIRGGCIMEKIFIENNWHFVKIKGTGLKLLATELAKGVRNHL